MVAEVANEVEELVGIAGEIVEEDATYTAAFVAMRDQEVAIAPGFEVRIEARVVFIALSFEVCVEVFCVVWEEIGGGQVGSSAEPPHLGVGGAFFLGRGRVEDLEVAVVEMDRRGHRVVGMDDEADPTGEEWQVLFPVPPSEPVLVQSVPHLCYRRRRKTAMHDRHIHSRLLEHRSLL